MDLNGIPLLAMLRGKLGYLSDRQGVIAQNVANASTPGYTPKDLTAFSFQAVAKGPALQAAMTRPGHMAPPSGSVEVESAWRAQEAPDSETTLDGNSVVLEEQMIKMTEARMEYDAAIGFYQKSMNLIRMAAKPPGR